MQLLIYWSILRTYSFFAVEKRSDLPQVLYIWALSSWAIKKKDILTALSTPINDSPIINNPDV